jgi:hypothetical protein
MSEDTTQAVVDETKVSATPDTTVDSARNDGTDLDTLLAQFDQQTTKAEPVAQTTQPVTQQTTQPQQDPIVARLVNRIERQDISNLVKQVKGDLDEDEDLVEAWIDARARKDPRLQRAWLEREANPQAFQEVAKGLGREFAKRTAKRPDPNLTEDQEAVAAAVRGSSTKAPEDKPPSFGGMSNAEYRQHVRATYGYDPGV